MLDDADRTLDQDPRCVRLTVEDEADQAGDLNEEALAIRRPGANG